MKKTLVALAALAATGAFAQATVSGAIAYGYASATSNANSGVTGLTAGTVAGLGVDTAEVNFAVSEDLGGGWKIAGTTGVQGGGNGAAATSTDTKLDLTTPAGVLGLGSTKGADYLSGGISGVAGIGFDGATVTGFGSTTFQNSQGIFNARSAKDYIAFTAPVGPVILSLNLSESSSDQGLGKGFDGSNNQRTTSYSATYMSGALVANLNFVQYSPAGAYKNITRGAASYDFGAVKVGGGISRTIADGTSLGGTDAAVVDSLIGVSVPMGALTIGAQYGIRDVSGLTGIGASFNHSVNATGLKLTYAMSKRTSLTAQLERHSIFNKADADVNSTFLLNHSF